MRCARCVPIFEKTGFCPVLAAALPYTWRVKVKSCLPFQPRLFVNRRFELEPWSRRQPPGTIPKGLYVIRESRIRDTSSFETFAHGLLFRGVSGVNTPGYLYIRIVKIIV